MYQLKKIFILLCIYFINSGNSFSVENKILLKVDNEIITSLDVKNEIKYLITLNKNLADLKTDSIFEIAKNSIIREIILKKEILKNFKFLKVKEEYLEQLIKSTYTKIGFNSEIEFKNYLLTQNLNIEILKKKLSIEALWNELIFMKYSKKVKINKENLKKLILEKKQKKNKSYLLSEILFNVSISSEYKKTFNKINQSIKDNGFENTASAYSISETAKLGGKLGWIDENLMSKKIISEIDKLKIGENSNAISVPTGFLILKVENIKFIQKNLNIDDELKKMIKNSTNQQLNQFSNLYYKRIKKDILINEL